MSIIHGCITALITPFKANGKLDEIGLEKLIIRQIKSGVHGIVPCGTTGESPTLSHEEHQEVIKIAIDITKKKIPVIAGTCLLYTSPSPRDRQKSRMPSSA